MSIINGREAYSACHQAFGFVEANRRAVSRPAAAVRRYDGAYLLRRIGITPKIRLGVREPTNSARLSAVLRDEAASPWPWQLIAPWPRIESSAVRDRCRSPHPSAPCGHVYRDAVVPLVIADPHLDVLTATIRSTDPMLVDMLIDGLSFRTGT
jgi:hypothetical protein